MKLDLGCARASAAIGLLALASQAHAATIFINNPSLFGGGVAGTVTAGPANFVPTSTVGALTGTMSGAPGYALLSSSNPLLSGLSFSFCVELNEQAVVGFANPDYSIVNPAASYFNWGANSAGISAQVDKLMSLAMPAIAAAPNAAVLGTTLGAVQLSLWELIYDYNPAYSYNLGTGVFQATTGAAVGAQASAWLAAATLSAAVPTAHYFVAQDPSHQDLLVTTAIPEPASWALMAAGMAALGALAQRRHRDHTAG